MLVGLPIASNVVDEMLPKGSLSEVRKPLES